MNFGRFGGWGVLRVVAPSGTVEHPDHCANNIKLSNLNRFGRHKLIGAVLQQQVTSN